VTQPDAGWYPDPAGSGGQRYWNGSGWTDHVTASLPEATDLEVSSRPEAGAVPPTADADAIGDNVGLSKDKTPDGSATDPDAHGHRGRQEWPGLPGQNSNTGGLPPVPPPPGESTPAPGGWPVDGPGPAQPGPGMSYVPPPQWPAASQGSGPVAGTQQRVVLGPDGQVLAGWWRRAFGLILDNILIWFFTLILVVMYGAVTGAFDNLIDQSAFNALLDKMEADPGYQPTLEEFTKILGSGWGTLIFLAVGCSLILGFINGVMLVARTGQTVSDRVVKLRKVVPGRHAPSVGAAAIRWVIPNGLNLLGNLPLIGFVALIMWLVNYLSPIWDGQNQTWQDKAARTHVERADLAGPLAP
jgi:hypothetical protein